MAQTDADNRRAMYISGSVTLGIEHAWQVAAGQVFCPEMSAATILALSEMSQAAKLRVMEELWDDLCHSDGGVPSPTWHAEVLKARAERVAKGEAEFHEWADVKEWLLRKKA